MLQLCLRVSRQLSVSGPWGQDSNVDNVHFKQLSPSFYE